MGLSVTQRFLVEAARACGDGDFFRWPLVGSALGYSAAESGRAVQSLNERKLVIALAGGDARLLAAGRQLVARIGAKSAGARLHQGDNGKARKHAPGRP